MVKMNESSTVMTLGLAADYLKISKAHLSNAINGKVEGVPKLPFARVGRRILIRREWADEWLEKAAGDPPPVNGNV
jgi:excisionase family DNA binding protein